MSEVPAKILLYDGDCGFCNRSVAFVLKHEKNKEIHFAPIQSEFTKALFTQKKWTNPDLSTVYFIINGQKFEKSSALIQIAKNLKAPQSWSRIMVIVPKRIRNYFYDIIASNRQKISKGYCVMPNESDRNRFIKT